MCRKGARGVVEMPIHECPVQQGFQQEMQQSSTVLHGKMEWCDPWVLIPVAFSARLVVVEYFLEGHEAAIMHVGSGQGKVAEARRDENANILLQMCQPGLSGVGVT